MAAEGMVVGPATWGIGVSVSTAGVGSSDADIQAEFAATLVDEWVRGGVRHAVVCPGSRSTAMAVALAAHPGMTVHVRLDERSGGFTALGIGVATGRPAVVLTTSGTAAAELHAAVVEADLAGVPLLACTADRPPELRDVGAPQTIDQTHLFGRAVRWFSDPGVPTSATRSSWRSWACRAVAEARWCPMGPGPVHLNLPFREPLLGDPDRGGELTPGRPDRSPWHVVDGGPLGPSPGCLPDLVESGRLSPAYQGLIVAGARCGDPATVLALSEALGWPVLADPRSGLRSLNPMVVGAADGLLRSETFVANHPPEVVLRLGERWVSAVVNGYLSSAAERGAHYLVVDPWGRSLDPEHVVMQFIRSDPTLFCGEVERYLTGQAAAGTEPSAGGPWLADWRRAEAAARSTIQRMLGGGGSDGSAPGAAVPDGPMTEPALAHRLFGRLPAGATLVVSSSMPVRDLEAFARPREQVPTVVANRGANGIDGVVSTALGVALAASGPTVALVGDLAFLHDVSALVRADGLEADLTVVVADNGGGGIFSFLPPASVLDPGLFDTLFATPQSPDPAAVATGFGWSVDEVDRAMGSARFEEALDRRLEEGGMSVIRVQLPRASDNVALHDRINAAIVEAVDSVGPAEDLAAGTAAGLADG
jgi:2-succinyl-5-enolpyruvyl-6-hydroxy-3-cyclohexene-1-carboxylate synthase